MEFKIGETVYIEKIPLLEGFYYSGIYFTPEMRQIKNFQRLLVREICSEKSIRCLFYINDNSHIYAFPIEILKKLTPADEINILVSEIEEKIRRIEEIKGK